MTNKQRLEEVIESLTNSLKIVAHNPRETEYVLELRRKYQEHYLDITGHYYKIREVHTKIDDMGKRFEGL